MPTLIIQQSGLRTGGRITERVLIGRLPTNGILINDSSVSRLHAWIDATSDGHYFIADTGSLTGTWVNGRAIEKRKSLDDGDVIKIGNVQITFSTHDHLPAGVSPINLGGLPPSLDTVDAGVLFDCPCGAPAWFKAAAIGELHQCRHCGRNFAVPATPGSVARSVSAPQIVEPGIPPRPALVRSTHEQLHDEAMLPDETEMLSEEHPVDEHGFAESSHEVTEDPHDHGLAEMPEEFTEAPHELEATHESATALSGAPSNGDSFDALLEEEGITAPIEETRTRIPQPINDPAPLPSPAVPARRLAEDAPPTPRQRAICSICHSPISDSEPTTKCPSCGLGFHSECWLENRGCSAYGCPQVGVLEPAPAAAAVVATATSTAPRSTANVTEVAKLMAGAAPQRAAPPPDPEPTGFPWEFMFLGTSVIGAVLGALVYGVPALIAAVGTLIYIAAVKKSRRGRAVALIAFFVCILGAAAGVYASYLYWNGWPPITGLPHHAGAHR